jgi:hypothetical protein
MSQVHAATGPDRLPWLPDEPTPPPAESHLLEIAGWLFAAILIVAGVAYWLTPRGFRDQPHVDDRRASSTTVVLPQAQVAQTPSPAPERVSANNVDQTPKVEVRQVARPEIELTEPSRGKSTAPRQRNESRTGSAAQKKGQALPSTVGQKSSAELLPSSSAQTVPAAASPMFHSPQAYGRVVQIGAFGSTHQAKLGWRYMVRAFPGVAHLHAAVVEARNSGGRPFYRFEIATSSQAHSEVLCQWMQQIHLSCAVVGLPWKPKGVER